jgi:hypothetical protein
MDLSTRKKWNVKPAGLIMDCERSDRPGYPNPGCGVGSGFQSGERHGMKIPFAKMALGSETQGHQKESYPVIPDLPTIRTFPVGIWI